MLIKMGVSIEFLRREARRALNEVDACFRAAGEEPVITSTRDGVHSPSSLHYADLAFDLRTPKKARVEDLRKALSPDYDVIVEETHWHIEYDPGPLPKISL